MKLEWTPRELNKGKSVGDRLLTDLPVVFIPSLDEAAVS
jgi:hypothetical protein